MKYTPLGVEQMCSLSDSIPLQENSVGDVLGILSISFGPDAFVANENILK